MSSKGAERSDNRSEDRFIEFPVRITYGMNKKQTQRSSQIRTRSIPGALHQKVTSITIKSKIKFVWLNC